MQQGGGGHIQKGQGVAPYTFWGWNSSFGTS